MFHNGEESDGGVFPDDGAFVEASESVRDDRYNQGMLEYIPRGVQPGIFSPRAIHEMDEVQVTLEEPWGPKIETTIRNWKDGALKSSAAHQDAGYRLKFKFRFVKVMLTFWAVVSMISNNLLQCDESDTAILVRLAIHGIELFWVGVTAISNMGYDYRVHFEYERKYAEYAIDVDDMLSRGEDFRVPADAFIAEMRERMKRLGESPEIPRSKYFFC